MWMMYNTLPRKISIKNVNGVECTYDASGKHSAVTPEKIQTMDITARYSVTAWARSTSGKYPDAKMSPGA
jgi:hypothetical protein